MELLRIKFLVVLLLPLFAFIVGTVYYRKLNIALKYLYYFVALGTITEVSIEVMFLGFNIRNNMLVGNAYFMLSFLLLGIYFLYLFKGYVHRKVFIVLIVLYELYFIVNLLFFQSIFEYSAIPKAISDIICFGLALVFFHKTMVEAKVEHIWKEPLVLVNLAILFYYSGSLFYSVLFNVILENAIGFTDFTTIFFYCLNVIFYLLIAVGFWKAGNSE